MLVAREGARCRVQRAWQDVPVVCIAGGPSLSEAQLALIAAARHAGRIRVIAVNDAYLVAPWADACYFADASWWRRQEKGFERFWPWVRFDAAALRAAHAGFAGQWISMRELDAIRDPRVHLMEHAGNGGLSPTRYGVCTGANSGFQALNLALLSGGNPVLLVAYDMRLDGRRTHSHNGHPRNSSEGQLRDWAVLFGSLSGAVAALGVRVLNCTPGSRITAFPMVPLAEALACVPAS
jgi:hypothetical protein